MVPYISFFFSLLNTKSLRPKSINFNPGSSILSPMRMCSTCSCALVLYHGGLCHRNEGRKQHKRLAVL